MLATVPENSSQGEYHAQELCSIPYHYPNWPYVFMVASWSPCGNGSCMIKADDLATNVALAFSLLYIYYHKILGWGRGEKNALNNC